MRVGGAVRVLRDAHAPDQARAAEGRAGVDPGRLRDVLGGHSRDSRGVVEVVLVDDAAPLVKTLGPVAYEALVVQPLVQDDLGHRVQEGDVGARPRPEPQLREVAHLDAPRVDDDELRPALDHGPPHPRRRHGVVRVGVRADYHQAARLLVVDVRVAGRAAAEGREHRLDRRRMAEPRAVVDVVRLHDDAGELLLHVAVLVRRLGRAEGRELVAGVSREALGDVVQRLVPRDRNELALAADQRRREAILVVHERVAEPALDAQHAQAGLVVGVVEHLDDPVCLVDARLDAAADAAVGTGGRDRLDRLLRRGLDLYCAGGADGQALAAGRAHGLQQRAVHEGADTPRAARAEEVDCADELVAILARLGAPAAEDAVVHCNVEHGVAAIYRLTFAAGPARRVYAVLPGRDGQLTMAVFPIAVAVRANHRGSQLQHGRADIARLVCARPHLHAVGGRHRARCGQAAHPVDLDETGAAGADGLHVGVLAQLRDVRARGVDGVEHRRAVADLDFVVVYSKGYGHGLPSL